MLYGWDHAGHKPMMGFQVAMIAITKWSRNLEGQGAVCLAKKAIYEMISYITGHDGLFLVDNLLYIPLFLFFLANAILQGFLPVFAKGVTSDASGRQRGSLPGARVNKFSY